ncbi:MAG: chorismate mutase [Rhodovarius sp.]|nr:chorismate mutase [Rhodovarius sp.]MCX7931370.1 chorismate mutase [Rhodovarius sp.]MDW8314294.1 chorismate mutase [Rhodovarius sp.]
MSSLLAVRAELDAIDDALHDLLMRRAEVVAGLAASRAKAGTPILRPGREAAILRRLLARHRGPLPAAVLVRLWRELLASSLRQQGSFRLVLGGGAAPLRALAAEHFGLLTATDPLPDPAAALAELAAGQAQAALLPLPDGQGEAPAPWWEELPGSGLAVIARLPFLTPAAVAGAAALLVAPGGGPDPSGDDRSLLLVAAAPSLSGERLIEALAQAGLSGRVLAWRAAPQASRWLVETDWLADAADPRLASLSAPPCSLQAAQLIGGYATPVGDCP